MATTATLGISKLEVGQAQKEATINEGFDLFDAAFAGINSKNLAGATTAQTLSATESRKFRHVFTNAGAALDVKFPLANTATDLLIKNSSGFTLTIKTDAGGSSGVAIPTGKIRAVWINGNNVEAQGPELDGTTGLISIGALPATIWARAYHNTTQSIANDTLTAVALNSERWDTDTIHDNSTNNSRLTCKTAGVYHVQGQLAYAANAAGIRKCAIRLNGSTYIANQDFSNRGAGTAALTSASTDYLLAVNDYVELIAYQDSGGSLNVTNNNNFSPEFSMVRLGS